MLNKIVLANPVTQTAEAVKQLIKYFNHGQEPPEMPEFSRITANMVLVQSNKKDAYYVTTPKICSCPSATYQPGQVCKHSRKYFSQPTKEELPEGAHMLIGQSMDSIRPGKDEGWPGGHNGPVDEVLGVA